MGYGAPAAVGAALANRRHGRLSINIQTDGDLNYAPGVLWTACHHQIPLLTVMHNNRAYHQEVMFIQQMSSRRNRGGDRAHIGTTIKDRTSTTRRWRRPTGCAARARSANPKDVAPAITRALERVRNGEPGAVGRDHAAAMTGEHENAMVVSRVCCGCSRLPSSCREWCLAHRRPTPTQPRRPQAMRRPARICISRYSCYACHGYDGHGGAGARLVPMRMTVERVHRLRAQPAADAAVFHQAAHATRSSATCGRYIKSLPVSPDAKDIPLLARS